MHTLIFYSSCSDGLARLSAMTLSHHFPSSFSIGHATKSCHDSFVCIRRSPKMSSTAFTNAPQCLGITSQAAASQQSVACQQRAGSLFVKNGLALDKAQQGDPFYRYQIPRLSVSYVGPHSGTTQLNNLQEIAAALQRPVAALLQHFSIELSVHGAHHINNTDSRYHLRGRHDMQRLIDILYIFIDRFVICRRCKDPTTLNFVRPPAASNGKPRLLMTCPSCGHVLDLLDSKANQWSSEKIVNFMLHASAASDSSPPTAASPMSGLPEPTGADSLRSGAVSKDDASLSKTKAKGKPAQGEQGAQPVDLQTALTLLTEPLKQGIDGDLASLIAVVGRGAGPATVSQLAELEAVLLKAVRGEGTLSPDAKLSEQLGGTMLEAALYKCLLLSMESMIGAASTSTPSEAVVRPFQQHTEALLSEGGLNHSMLLRLFGSESVETVSADELKLQKREKDAAEKATKKRKDDLDAFFSSAATDGEPASHKGKKATKEKAPRCPNGDSTTPPSNEFSGGGSAGGEAAEVPHRGTGLPPVAGGSKERHQLRVGCLIQFLTKVQKCYSNNWKSLSTQIGELVEMFFTNLIHLRLILPRDVRAVDLAGHGLGKPTAHLK
jgi:translation initiation factor 2 beta subunit (eIF-2beta)/eIF-5